MQSLFNRQENSVEDRTDRILASGSKLIRRAKTLGGIEAAERNSRGGTLMGQAMAGRMMDYATPIASQDSAQGFQGEENRLRRRHESELQRGQLDHEQLLQSNSQGHDLVVLDKTHTNTLAQNRQQQEHERGLQAGTLADRAQDRQLQRDLQTGQLSHEQTLQRFQQGHELSLQERDFINQNVMQKLQQGHELSMQERNFALQAGLINDEQAHQMAMAQLTEKLRLGSELTLEEVRYAHQQGLINDEQAHQLAMQSSQQEFQGEQAERDRAVTQRGQDQQYDLGNREIAQRSEASLRQFYLGNKELDQREAESLRNNILEQERLGLARVDLVAKYADSAAQRQHQELMQQRDLTFRQQDARYARAQERWMADHGRATSLLIEEARGEIQLTAQARDHTQAMLLAEMDIQHKERLASDARVTVMLQEYQRAVGLAAQSQNKDQATAVINASKAALQANLNFLSASNGVLPPQSPPPGYGPGYPIIESPPPYRGPDGDTRERPDEGGNTTLGDQWAAGAGTATTTGGSTATGGGGFGARGDAGKRSYL